MRPTVLTLLRNSRAALWAALLSLGLLQAAVAGHADEHLFEDAGESCEFCLKLGETKTSLADSGAASALPCPAVCPDATTGDAFPTLTARRTAIRAPPLL